MVTPLDSNTSPRIALVAVTNSATRALCSETLRAIGFTVTNGIESGSDVISKARERHPEIIILSEQLNDVPASEAVKWLRANRQSAASAIIVVGSANDTPGADGHLALLPRAFTRSQLRDALGRLLGPEERPATPPVQRSH